MYCKKCGKEVNESFAACPYCGTSLNPTDGRTCSFVHTCTDSGADLRACTEFQRQDRIRGKVYQVLAYCYGYFSCSYGYQQRCFQVAAAYERNVILLNF